MRSSTAILVAALAWTGAAAGRSSLTPDERRLNIESFEEVWTTVRDKHWDPSLGGLDWQAVHDELRPAVENASTMEEARQAMAKMLKRLKETHFGIVPSDVYGEMKTPGGNGDGGSYGEGDPGIEVRVIDGHALVTALEPTSPAAAAGVKPGWEIVKVDGKEIAKGLRLIERKSPDSTLLEVTLVQSVAGSLSGDVGTRVKVQFLDAADRGRWSANWPAPSRAAPSLTSATFPCCTSGWRRAR